MCQSGYLTYTIANIPGPNLDLENVEKPVNLSESTSQVVNIHESDFPPRPTQPDTISDAPTVPRTSQEAIDAAAQTTNPQQTASQDREGSIDSSCSSSAMDESMGSSEGDEDDVDEDELPAIQSETESPGSAPVNRSEPTMELPKVDDVETMSTGERSAPLDDYEPPEPDIASHSDSPFSSSSGLEETFPLQPGAPDVQQMPLDQKIETLTITDQGSPKEIPIANSKVLSCYYAAVARRLFDFCRKPVKMPVTSRRI